VKSFHILKMKGKGLKY